MRALLLSIAFVSIVASTVPVYAQTRVALVIGNGAYVKVPRLDNPKNDASAMEAMFKAAGFAAVVRTNDLGAAAMRRALRDFSDTARDADIAVVFYAGHGIEVGGINYLVPIDAVLERDIDAQDEAIPLDRVNQILEPVKLLRLVILDACRDNPFARSMRRTIATRSVRSGYGEIDERFLPSNTLVAYAQRAGSTAEDGAGSRNSPYTTALLKHLPTPGLDVELALRRVRDEVLRTTNNRQEPFKYGSFGGAEIALVSGITNEARKAEEAKRLEDLKLAQEEMRQAQASLKAAQAEREVALKAAEEARKEATKVASLPTTTIVKQPETSSSDPSVLATALQKELKRVGCDPGAVNGTWGPKAKQALEEFARTTKLSIPFEQPSDVALSAVALKKGKICASSCGAGETEINGKCVAKAKPEIAAQKKPQKPEEKPNTSGGSLCWADSTFSGTNKLVPCGGSFSSGNKAF